MGDTIRMWDGLSYQEQLEYKRKAIDLILKGYIDSDMSDRDVEYYSKRMYYGDIKSKKASA